jgi:hypothetical protein
MRHARNAGRGRGLALLLAAAGSVTSAGCTHNYYYGTPQACIPTAPGTVTASSAVPYGSVCDVPTQVVGGSTVVAGTPAPGTTTVLSGPKPPRVVLSEPNHGPRLSWRRADPETSMATTRVEGGVTDSSLTR